MVAAASLVQASHAVYYGFSTLDWRAAGLDGTTIGALWALGVVAEIALFALSGRLPAWIGPTVLLAIGGAGATLRWGAMAFDPPVWLLPALQGLHGLSFGATHLGGISFLAASRAARRGGDGARRARRRARAGHGRGDGRFRRALRGVRRPRLRGHGADRRNRRRHRTHRLSHAPCAGNVGRAARKRMMPPSACAQA